MRRLLQCISMLLIGRLHEFDGILESAVTAGELRQIVVAHFRDRA